MEKFKRYVKTHKVESTIGGIFLLMLIFLLIFIKIFFFSSGNNTYGDRLEGIDKVKISEDKLDKIAVALKGDASIQKVESHITGKIINFTVTVNADANIDQMRTKAGTILEDFSNDENEFYDIQVFLVSSDDATSYPTIGYKGKGTTELLWIRS
ncbi:MAG: hypothetical protein PHN72_04755 [Bacilli bacterium]|nr:hypothetical protein [Bacilli bacterium]